MKKQIFSIYIFTILWIEINNKNYTKIIYTSSTLCAAAVPLRLTPVFYADDVGTVIGYTRLWQCLEKHDS